MIRTLRFISLLFNALALGPALAHLFELPNKIGLDKESYLVVQNIYKGWWFLGAFEVITLLSTFILLLLVRHSKKVFLFTFYALMCFIAELIIFFAFTFPVNQVTNNWTTLPTNWMRLRRNWEYSHAAGAILALTGFILLLLATLKDTVIIKKDLGEGIV